MMVNGHFLGAIVLVLVPASLLGGTPLAAAALFPDTQSTVPASGYQTPAPATPLDDPAGPEAGDVPPEQVSRVRKALEHKPLVNLNGDQLQFYVQIIGRPPMSFAEYAKGSDLMHGPTRRGNPMTHQEFLNMVTPREMYSSGGITPSELLQFALTNWLGQTLVRRGLEEINEARTESEKQAIRDRIDRELLILKANERN
jgi:hypothetical protein